MKSYIIKTVVCASLTFCALNASADIKDLFQKGAQIEIGDSIKGQMLKFATDGVLHFVNAEATALPTECKIVLQENGEIWMENLFPIHTEKDYHKWLKGEYIKEAKFKNPVTNKEEVHDIVVIYPFETIDYKEWKDVDNKYTTNLTINKVVKSSDAPDLFLGAIRYKYPDQRQQMESYIKFIINDDMSLHSIDMFGEQQTKCESYINYYYTCPYGINMNKLPYQEYTGYGSCVTYISNLKLTPIL